MMLAASAHKNEGSESEPPSDMELVKRCKAGDRDALERLFQRYYPEVHRMMLRILGPCQDLDDVIQNTMLEIHRSLHNFRGESKLSSWIYRIAINVANQHLRKKTRLPITSEIQDDLISDKSPSPLQQYESKERVQVLFDVVRSLPDKKREAFILAEIEQLGSEEIAVVLDCSVSAVWSRLHHARRLFWNKVRNQGYFQILEDTGKTENPSMSDK